MPVIFSSAASRISLKNSLLKWQNRKQPKQKRAHKTTPTCALISGALQVCKRGNSGSWSRVQRIFCFQISWNGYEQNAHFRGSLNFPLKYGYRDLRKILLPGLIFYVCMYRHTCCNNNYLGLFFSFLLITLLFTADSILSWLQHPLPRKLWRFLVQHIACQTSMGQKVE